MDKLRDSLFQRVAHLFDDDYPNLPFVHGVIEGVLPGEIYTDNEHSPTQCLVKTNGPFAYSIGLAEPDDIASALRLLRDRCEIKLVVPGLSASEAASYGLKSVPRRHYRYGVGHPAQTEEIPGYKIVRVANEALLRRCQRFEFMSAILGSPENFLARAAAFVLWDPVADEIASEAFAIRSQRFAEIATVTHPGYRTRRLSTPLCNQLVHWTMAQGLEPVWSCDELNVASWHVAEKLGMDRRTRYTFFDWATNNAAAR